MADLSVTIGADTTELEKKAKDAGKTIKKELSGGEKTIKGLDFASNLMSGNIGAAVGGLFGPVGQAVGAFVDQLKDKAKELMDNAIQLRNLSYQTGLSSQQIQGLESIAKASGISVGKLADSISEFNRRIGYAQIHGGELNFLFNKLGVSMEKVKNGTFTYFDAIDALGKAQAAGTDEAILNHYAQTMLGSSYKELLPLIKMGSNNLKLYSEAIYKNSQQSLDALSRAGDSWNIFTENVKNMAMEMLGWFLAEREKNKIQKVAGDVQSALARGDIYEAAKMWNKGLGPGYSNEQKLKIAQNTLKNPTMSETGVFGLYNINTASSKDQIQKFAEAFKEITGMNVKGTNLNPYGLGPAQGASQMQQMGGGDLFGAVTFNPVKEIADNTKQTVVELQKMSGSTTPPANPNRDDLNK
jgi:hypothetical protein